MKSRQNRDKLLRSCTPLFGIKGLGVATSNDNAMGGIKTIEASEFKAKCLKLLDEIAETGGDIIITKKGHPVSRLGPYREKPKTLWGIDRGKFEILGDIIEPIDVEWEAETDKPRGDAK